MTHYTDGTRTRTGTIRRLPMGWVRFTCADGYAATVRPDSLTQIEVITEPREPDNGPERPLVLPMPLPVLAWDETHEAYGHAWEAQQDWAV